MALVFGAATSDRVDCGSAAGIDTPSSLTVAAWVRPSTLTPARIIIGKTDSSVGWRMYNGASNRLGFYWDRATTDLEFVSADNFQTTNTWAFVAATADSSGAKVYRGTLTTPAAEPGSYATSNVGSGSFVSDASLSLLIGNRSSTINLSYVGQIAVVGYWHNRILTLEELIAWQWHPGMYHPEMNLFLHLGYNGTDTQVDWSGAGNHGTITGATLGDHVPLGAPFAGFDAEPYIVIPSAGGMIWHPGMTGGMQEYRGGMRG